MQYTKPDPVHFSSVSSAIIKLRWRETRSSSYFGCAVLVCDSAFFAEERIGDR
jgi:hypothetical protein